MNTTRAIDLDTLDSKRFNRKEEGSKEHVQAVLTAVYVQSKDTHLERLRNHLTSILQRLEEEGESEQLWLDYVAQLAKIKDYCNTPEFVTRVARAIAREAGEAEANKYILNKGI